MEQRIRTVELVQKKKVVSIVSSWTGTDYETLKPYLLKQGWLNRATGMVLKVELPDNACAPDIATEFVKLMARRGP